MPRQSTRQRKTPDRYKPYDFRHEPAKFHNEGNKGLQTSYNYQYRPGMTRSELEDLENWRDYALLWILNDSG
jgi:hypothetical protein